MGRGHGVLVEALAGCGPAARLIAVIRGYAGEAAATRRRRFCRDRRIGVVPMMLVVVSVVMAVAAMRFGRTFGHAASDEECSGGGNKYRSNCDGSCICTNHRNSIGTCCH